MSLYSDKIVDTPPPYDEIFNNSYDNSYDECYYYKTKLNQFENYICNCTSNCCNLFIEKLNNCFDKYCNCYNCCTCFSWCNNYNPSDI
jgi:hypothetical protein